MAFSPGDVVLVPFPFRDRLAEATRPAVVVSNATYNQQSDVVVAAITSATPRFPTNYSLQDWRAAGLQFASTVRMLMATVADARIVHQIDQLSSRDWNEVSQRVAQTCA